MKTIIIAVASICIGLSAVAGEVNIVSFGAVADGKTINTKFIQSAIDKANQDGGGTVIVPEGVFLTGSIVLKTGVELRLEKNAVLLGSTNPFDYRGLNRWKALVLADGQENISITGKGTIDGQGRRLALNVDSLFYIGELDSVHYNLRRKRPNEHMRPQNIEMVNCSNVKISEVTVKNAACWVQTYDRCINLTIERIRVESDAYWNNDGMDISDCKNVIITGCYVNSADDGICLKSHSAGYWNDNITISDCTVRSSASAIKFGTASTGGFKNVKIENIKVFDTFRSAIAIESVDGGVLENIEVNNINAANTGNAIFIRLGHRNSDGPVGTLRNVTIKNVKAQIAFDRPDNDYDLRGPDLAFFHNPFPCTIAGIPGHNVENVKLENIEITFPGRGNNGLAYLPINRLNDVPEQKDEYPEFSMFGELPAWAFYVRHVNGLILNNVVVKAEAPDYRPAFVFDDVKNLQLDKISISKANNNPVLILKDVEGEKISNVSVSGFDGEIIKTVK
ncbi:MAG TPA: glycosyl hydrolase family 28 protein [Draconibacterium sp.]|nr:glycosyl hydrolase family 28 protein [Draconibacterium sp.]